MAMRKFTEPQLRAIRYYVAQMSSIIDDLSVATNKCWSSYKIDSELTRLKGLFNDLKASFITNEEVDEMFE